MPANFPMPAAERVSEVLADLMGRSVTVARTQTAEIAGRTGALADYQVDAGTVGVVCVADVRLANALGASSTTFGATIVNAAPSAFASRTSATHTTPTVPASTW